MMLTSTSLRRRTLHLLHEVSESSGAPALLAAAAAVGMGRRVGAPRSSLLMSALGAGFLGWYYRDTAHRPERVIRRAESAVSLSAPLGMAAPVFGRWADEGDFAGMIVRELERSPQLVVECGSGATSLIIADKLRQNGSGRVVSLEHDLVY